MKRILLIIFAGLLVSSCNRRSESEQKEYTDSLFHVLSCSPTIVDGPYSLEDQLNACDLLMDEYPEKKDEFETIKKEIEHQIQSRDSNSLIDDL